VKNVTRLKNLQNRAFLLLRGFRAIHGLMQMRIEGHAQGIDTLAYGVEGYASVAFPEISKAFTGEDAAALETAIARARAAVDRATAALQ